jgi:hypothetical protein
VIHELPALLPDILVCLQPSGHVLYARPGGEQTTQGPGLLDRHGRALGEERQRRVRGVAEERGAAADPGREPGEDAQLPFEDLALRGEVQDGEERGVVVLELG